MKQSRWSRLCKSVEEDDGLPVRKSGPWAAEKLFFWNRYIEITTTAMVGKPGWKNGVSYVDLFSGPGVCQVAKTGERFPGSPLIAANAPKPFETILLCELDDEVATGCEQRMKASPAASRFQLFRGDCNQEVGNIASALPRGSLTLAFLDPTGLHLHLQTVQKLSQHGPVDLLILFPDAVDILRNVDHLYFDQPDSNLDLVLGPGSNWRARKEGLTTDEGSSKRRLFADIYIDQLRTHAGYQHFAEEVICGQSGPLYRLVYATKHSRGIDFWTKSVKKELGGQNRLF